MIPTILTVFTAASFYGKAKKVGVSKTKWTIIGILISLLPLTLTPIIIIKYTGREDLDGPALMGAVIIVIVASAIIQRKIR